MLIDLSHPIEDGLTTYPGLPVVRLSTFQSRSERQAYDEDTSFLITGVEMVGNTATYVDAPFHRYDNGDDLASLPLDRLVDLDAVMVPTDQRQIGREIFDSVDVREKAVLVATGWSRHWKSPEYFGEYPFLTDGAADYLVGQGARLVGIDSVNIDDARDPKRPVHSRLLAAGIPIVEHLCGLASLPPRGARFFAAPPRIVGGTSFPVRAFAVVSDPKVVTS